MEQQELKQELADVRVPGDGRPVAGGAGQPGAEGTVAQGAGQPVAEGARQPVAQGTAVQGDVNPQQAAQDLQAPQFKSTFETGRHYKVHKSYIWLGPLLATVLFVVIAGFNGLQAWISLAQAIVEGELLVNPLLVTVGVLGGIAVLYGLMVGLYALGYKNMSFVFDEREFSFYSGIITKRRVHLPYARVQSVHHQASIAQRLAGVCTVSIDTAGGAQNKAVRVPFLQLSVAERLRIELFTRKAAVAMGVESQLVYVPEADPTTALGAQRETAVAAANRGTAPVPPVPVGYAGMPGAAGMPAANAPGVPGSAPVGQSLGGLLEPNAVNALDSVAGDLSEWRGMYGGAIAGLEPATYEFGLTNKELLYTSLSHSTPIWIAVAIGFSVFVTLGGILLGDPSVPIVSSIFWPIFISSTVLSYVLGLVGIAVSYGAFKAQRRGSRIEVERGLLQRSFSGIDIDRVQSVEVRQSFIRRLLGYCEISLGRINAASEQQEGKSSSLDARGLVIHPFVKIDRVDEIIDGLAPELSGRPRVVDIAPLPSVAMRRELVRRCLIYNVWLYIAIAAIASWALFVHFASMGSIAGSAQWVAQAIEAARASLVAVLALCGVGTAFAAFGAVLWARHSGYAFNKDYIALHNDGLATHYMMVPRCKIQSGTTRDNPFQRRLSLTSLIVTTAAGTSSTSMRILDVPAEAGASYLDWLKPRR